MREAIRDAGATGALPESRPAGIAPVEGGTWAGLYVVAEPLDDGGSTEALG